MWIGHDRSPYRHRAPNPDNSSIGNLFRPLQIQLRGIIVSDDLGFCLETKDFQKGIFVGVNW
jgi:hypothetical protein